jgi:hypothetical protein
MESYFFKNRKKVGSWSHTFCVQGKEETLVPQSNSTLNNSKPPPTKEKPSLSVIKGQSRKLDFDGAQHQSCVVCGCKSTTHSLHSTYSFSYYYTTFLFCYFTSFSHNNNITTCLSRKSMPHYLKCNSMFLFFSSYFGILMLHVSVSFYQCILLCFFFVFLTHNAL